MKLITHFTSLPLRDLAFLLLVLAFIGNLLWKYQVQSSNHIALLIQPMAYDTVTPLRFYTHWNIMTTKDHAYDVQVSETKQFFNPISVCEESTSYDCTLFDSLKPSFTYFVRIRSKRDGITYPWTAPREFYTGPLVPTKAISEFE